MRIEVAGTKPSPTVIVIGGAYRSGSTWQMNAVRLLCEAAGKSVSVGDWRGTWRYKWRTCDTDVLLVKEHHWCADLASYAALVFTTSRDWDDVKDSWERFKGPHARPDDVLVAMWKQWLRKWRTNPNHATSWEYEFFIRYPHVCFSNLSRVLSRVSLADDIRLDCEVERHPVFLELQALRPPAEGYDPETCMFANHITTKTSDFA